MSQTAAFIMPVKIKGNELELRFFRDAVESIKRQTDKDWIIINKRNPMVSILTFVIKLDLLNCCGIVLCL